MGRVEQGGRVCMKGGRGERMREQEGWAERRVSSVRLGRAAAPKSSNSPVSANLGSFRSHHLNPVSRLSPCPFNSHATVHPLLCGPSFPLQSAHFLTPTPVLHHSKLFHQASSLRSSFNLRIAQRLFLPFSQIFTLFHPSSTNH